jgi:hypothetical protein
VQTTDNSIQNLLLAGLPAVELAQLVPLLKPTGMVRKNVIYNVGDTIDFVYFPSGGLIAEVATLAAKEPSGLRRCSALPLRLTKFRCR